MDRPTDPAFWTYIDHPDILLEHIKRKSIQDWWRENWCKIGCCKWRHLTSLGRLRFNLNILEKIDELQILFRGSSCHRILQKLRTLDQDVREVGTFYNIQLKMQPWKKPDLLKDLEELSVTPRGMMPLTQRMTHGKIQKFLEPDEYRGSHGDV